jgi:hypothetical protein
MDEIKAGRKDDDPILDWISIPEIETSLMLDQLVDVALVQHVVSAG